MTKVFLVCGGGLTLGDAAQIAEEEIASVLESEHGVSATASSTFQIATRGGQDFCRILVTLTIHGASDGPPDVLDTERDAWMQRGAFYGQRIAGGPAL